MSPLRIATFKRFVLMLLLLLGANLAHAQTPTIWPSNFAKTARC